MVISALEHGDRVAVLERDHGLLPPGRGPAAAATGDRVAAHLHGPHAGGRDPEQLRERVPDLVLVGLGVHLEGVHLARLVGGRALLGHHRADDDLVQRGHHLLPFFLGAAFFVAGFPAAFLAALAVLFFAALALVADFLAALAAERLGALAVAGSSGWAGRGSGITPVSAPASTTAASDHRIWYAAASG